MIIRTTVSILLLAAISAGAADDASKSPEKKKDLNWRQLSAIYEVPDWYKNAKLGIWTHWGPQSFPERGGGWYARHMYMQDVGPQKWGKDAYTYHCQRFVHPSEVGYKDVLHQ